MLREDESANAHSAAGYSSAASLSGQPAGTTARSGRKGIESRMGQPVDGARAVRIGREPAAREAPLAYPTSDSSALDRVAEELAQIRDMVSNIERRKQNGEHPAQEATNVEVKFDRMREAFDTLEAHVSIGLKNSIAEAVRLEFASLREETVLQKNYRTRYRIACGVLFVVTIAIIGQRYADQLRDLMSIF